MSSERERDADFSECVQEKVVIPKFIKKVYPGSRIISSDLQKDNEIACVFDHFGTTDKLLIRSDFGLILMGMRIQRPEYASRKSITIREKRIYKNNFERASEYQKLINAIAKDTAHANLLCHCYVNGDTCETANDIIFGVIAKTKPLLEVMLDKPYIMHDGWAKDEDRQQEQKFKYVYTSTLEKISRDIRTEIIIAELKKGKIVHPWIGDGPITKQSRFDKFVFCKKEDSDI